MRRRRNAERAFLEEVDALAVRREPLGEDRNHARYWWYVYILCSRVGSLFVRSSPVTEEPTMACVAHIAVFLFSFKILYLYQLFLYVNIFIKLGFIQNIFRS